MQILQELSDSDYAAGVLQKIRRLCNMNKNVDSHHMHANFDLWSRMYDALVKWPSRQIEVTVVKSHTDASC